MQKSTKTQEEDSCMRFLRHYLCKLGIGNKNSLALWQSVQ